MEDDDEFGDLYTDVLPTSFRFDNAAPAPAAATGAAAPPRPADPKTDSDDDDILFGASNSTVPGLNLNEPIKEEARPQPEPEPKKLFDLNLESNSNSNSTPEVAKLPERASNFVEDDDEIDIVLEERENNKDVGFVEKDEDLRGKHGNSIGKDANDAEFVGKNDDSMRNDVDDIDLLGGNGVGETMIPGLSTGAENQADFDDDVDSEESEDDLQIVLNEGQMGNMMMMGMDDEDDEDGDGLVIVADNGDVGPMMMMEEQDWAGEEGGPGGDGEKKETGDAEKPGAAGPAAVQPKVGYSNHMAYHHPFHSQFKYVRPGAAPMPGPPPLGPGVSASQVRPTVTMGPGVGRGRGEWRPTGLKPGVPMQKGFHPQGMSAWGANAAGRGFGTGLDFTLPSHKTIFEVDIDSFEDKPWRLPGMDISVFFNFDLNEDSWKAYCKQLEQLRAEKTMQGRIRVYESGRTEQDYDPDLPPELAAAVGMQDTPSENANLGKADAVANDLARRGRPSPPIGRPIPVETGSGDRLPSIDTRRPRMPDTDAIIEIFCQIDNDDMEEHEEREDVGGSDQIDDTRSNGVGGDEALHRDLGVPPEDRRAKGKESVSSRNMTADGRKREKEFSGNQKEESYDSADGKHSPLSSPSSLSSDGEQAVEDKEIADDELVTDDRSVETGNEENLSDAAVRSDTLEEDKLMPPLNRSEVQKTSQENDDGEDSKTAISSETSGGRSGSSKEYRKLIISAEDEVLQDESESGAGNTKRPIGDEDNAHRKSHREREEIAKHRVRVRGREDSYEHRAGDPNSSFHRHGKSEFVDRRMESVIPERGRLRREENLHGRRVRTEDSRKREYDGEIGSRHMNKVRESERSQKDEYLPQGNQPDNGSWQGAHHDMRSRQRDREAKLKNRDERVDDHKRRKEGHVSRELVEKGEMPHSNRESSSRRKRERDDGLDQWKRDDLPRLKDDVVNYARQKEEASFNKERSDRLRERDDWFRLKQSHEETSSRRRQEETRAGIRGGRPAEDKSWTRKDEYRASGREYNATDVGRYSEQLKRRDRGENEDLPQHRGHEIIHSRGNPLGNDEKRPRHEKPVGRSKHVPSTADTSRLNDKKHRDGSRKSKESDSGDHISSLPPKRNQDEHSGKARRRGRTEQQSGESEIPLHSQSSRKLGEEASSDDEQPSSKKGRSKLERWASHKERDFSLTSKSSSSLKSKDMDNHSGGAPLVSKLPDEPSEKVEDKPQPSAADKDNGGVEANNVDGKAREDKHLDTVEKLKKRSERFKLPMPSEKDAMTVKKIENEPLPSSQTDVQPNKEIKSERPARKRRWTGN